MITGRTECGVAYAVKRKVSAVAHCSLSIKAGTRDEQGYHSGIAHFTEHTVFKGTRKKSSTVINNYLDRFGGELNAFTTKEEIVFHATVLKEDFRKAVSLLLELATQATFPDDEVETERGVVIDEIKSYKDSPAEDIYDCFEELLFEGHPLSGKILGSEESVGQITADELRRFVKEKFRPELMALTIVADIDEKSLEKTAISLIDKSFVHDSAEVDQPRGRKLFTPAPKKFDISIDKHNNEANAVIGCFAPSLYEDEERYAAVLLGNILAGPSSNSILNGVLREKYGWVYSVEAGYTQYSDTGVMVISLGCDKPNLEKCCRAIRKEILKLQTLPLSDRKLAAAKKQLLGQLAISSDNGEAECLSLGKSLISFGRVNEEGEVRRKVETITAEQVRNICCKIFDLNKLSRLIFL